MGPVPYPSTRARGGHLAHAAIDAAVAHLHGAAAGHGQGHADGHAAGGAPPAEAAAAAAAVTTRLDGARWDVVTAEETQRTLRAGDREVTLQDVVVRATRRA